MCGIAGWVGDVGGDQETLGRMCAAVRHRGPDDDGMLIDPGKAALGFRRLAVIDLETGAQPIADERERCHVVCNGEIYNFRALRARLEAGGHRFRTASDCEVILHLYEEQGPDCLKELEGMFALALWDRHAERLLLARDRLGVKPLYWAAVGDGLLFASEPGAILASGLVPAAPDPRALLEYMTLQYVPAPRSGFAGIHKLAPGECLVHEDGRTRVEPYWSLDFAARPPRSEAEALEELDTLLSIATRERLVADVPLGAFLSGGIDSSLVVGYMAEAVDQVRTFSIDFAEEGFGEGAHARRVAALYGTEHEEWTLGPEIAPLVADVARFAGEPFADSSAIPTLLLARMTRRQVTVALSGDGGDEAFAGYPRYRETDRLRRRLGSRTLSPGRRYAQVMSHFAPAELTSLCEPSFLEAAGSPWTAWDETLAPAPLRGVDRYLELDTRTYLPGDLLLKVDRMSMSTALEVRSPLLDRRVHELAAALPGRMKLRGGETKWALKELARRRGLPEDLVSRPKQGFGVPVGRWLRGELRPWVEDLLLDGRATARGYFDPVKMRALVSEHLSGGADHTYKVWNLVMLEAWHRTWIDRE
jgi:asparagine synthase (glutamine-hydrolysing)